MYPRKIPLFTHSDESCIQIALRTCNYIDREHPRIVHIQDTMNLEEIYISEAMLEEAKAERACGSAIRTRRLGL